MFNNKTQSRFTFLFSLACSFILVSCAPKLNCADKATENIFINYMLEKTDSWARFTYEKDNIVFDLAQKDPNFIFYSQEMQRIKDDKIKLNAECYEMFKHSDDFKNFSKDSHPFCGEHARLDMRYKDFSDHNQSLKDASIEFQNTNLYKWIINNLHIKVTEYEKFEKKQKLLTNEILKTIDDSIRNPNLTKLYLTDIRTSYYDKKIGSIGCKANFYYENKYFGKQSMKVEYTIETTSENIPYFTLLKWNIE